MKILVSIKRVIDYHVKIRVKPDFSDVETNNVKMSMNPFDAIALEEAIRLKEKSLAKEVIAISIGEEACQEILRLALAMGADRAIHVKTNQKFQPIVIARILQQVVQTETPSLVLLGKQAIDDDCNQTGQMLAGLLNWPQGTFASTLVIENQNAIVTRETDEGLETLSLELPAIITSDLRLNEPRYPSLPNIMQAKKKVIQTVDFENLNIETQTHLSIEKVMPAETRKTGVILESVDELVQTLHLDQFNKKT